jgi:predicted 3-demethylubiquinone-9 3-methyltransferase (glyoxalase superfamily)
MSLVALCDTQEEIDRLWDKLTEGGGKPGPCGWLTDHFGVSWQIVPVALGKMLTDARSGNAAKAMEAMLKMGKIDIGTLEKAYKS